MAFCTNSRIIYGLQRLDNVQMNLAFFYSINIIWTKVCCGGNPVKKLCMCGCCYFTTCLNTTSDIFVWCLYILLK